MLNLLLELAVSALELGPAGGIGMIEFQVEGIMGIDSKDAAGVAIVDDDLEFDVWVDGASQAEGVAAQSSVRRPQYLAQRRFQERLEILIGRQVEKGTSVGRDGARSTGIGQGQENTASPAQKSGC